MASARFDARMEDFTDPVDGAVWHIDVGFTGSRWTCIWNEGCEGILDQPAAILHQGCCSVGAHFIDEDEAMLIGALGVTLAPERFQNHAAASAHGVFAAADDTDGEHGATRVVDDACVFFNRPGFPGGEGCALHLAAIDEGESPMDWKPSICWQSPLKVDRHRDGSKTLRPWSRSDWGPDGAGMAYCCTDRNPDGASNAYRGSTTVAESLHAELVGLVGPEIAVELRTRAGRT